MDETVWREVSCGPLIRYWQVGESQKGNATSGRLTAPAARCLTYPSLRRIGRALLLCLILAACSSGGQTPTPPVSPIPPAWSADWSTFQLKPTCQTDDTATCSGEGWLTFDWPDQRGCVDVCVTGGTALSFTMPWQTFPGLPVIWSTPFDGAVSLQAEVSAVCEYGGCYAGPVLYVTEQNYKAVYLQWAPDGRVQPYMYSTTFKVPLGSRTFAPGERVLLGLRYDGHGGWDYEVNGVTEATESADHPLGQDGTLLLKPPHTALWLGMSSTIGKLEVYNGPR